MKKYFKKGLTLIEMIFYVLFLTVILGVITNFFYQIANFKVNQQVQSDLFQNSTIVINKINQDLVSKPIIVSPLDENFHETLVISISGEQITYEIINGVLKRNGSDLTDNKVTINLSVPNYGFRKIGNSLQLKFQLSAKQKPFGQAIKSQVYQTAIFLGY